MNAPLTETADAAVGGPFYDFEANVEEQDRLVLDAYHLHVAPYLGRQECCSSEASRLYSAYIESLGLNISETKFPWVPVGNVGCLPVIGHLDPVRFHQTAPLPQWYAPRVLVTETFYFKSLDCLHEVLEQGGNDSFFTPPDYHLPRLPPQIESRLDALECLVDFGIYPNSEDDERREQLRRWLDERIDALTLEQHLYSDPLFAGFDAAIKYLEKMQPCIDARQVEVNGHAQASIPQSVAEQNDLLAFFENERATFVLSPYTERFHLGDLIAQKRGNDREVLFILVSTHHQQPHLAAADGLRLRQLNLENGNEILEGESESISTAEIQIKKRDVARLDVKANDVSNERLVHWLLFQAVTIGASDIHIEQTAGSARVRMRVDGSLITMHKMSLGTLKGVLAMIKNTCGMNPSHLDTDDNRFAVHLEEKLIDVRVSAVPFRRGYQKVVMRLLDKGAGFKRLKDLRLPERHESIIRHASLQQQGLILVSGPTGSGKSTTLYAILDSMNNPNANIHTIEDPIEYELDGLNQTQINPQRHLTYERVLRSLLRQDPDVIMIGEIRDRETAEAAANAALTGHLVLSTLHSLSSIKSVKRLSQMGVPPYMLGESLILLQAQRLIRRLCDCKHPIPPSPRQIEQFENNGIEPPGTIYLPSGCSACLNTGYKGRVAVMELCPIDDVLSDMIASEASTSELERAALELNFRSLFQEALEHCAKGAVGYDVAMELDKAW